MEPHRLRALIEEDVSRYPGSASGEINRRVGPEVPYRTLKRALDDLVGQGRLRFEGQARAPLLGRVWPVMDSRTCHISAYAATEPLPQHIKFYKSLK